MLEYVGYIFVSIATLFDALYVLPYKVEALAKVNAPPHVFFLYSMGTACIWALISSAFLFLNYQLISGGSTEFQFLWLGFFSGLLTGITFYLYAYAIDLAGITLGHATTVGACVIVSILYSLAFLNQDPTNMAMYLCGVFIVCFGIAAVAMNHDIVRAYQAMKTQTLSEHDGEAQILLSQEPLPPIEDSKSWKLGAKTYGFGIIISVLAGTFNGLMLVPYYYVTSAQQGLAFIPSFGIGVLFVGIVAAFIAFVVSPDSFSFYFDQPIVLQLGCLSGTIMIIQMSFMMFSFNLLSYGIVMPLVNCSIIFSAAAGIIIWKEITDDVGILAFCVSAVAIIGGAAMVSIGG